MQLYQNVPQRLCITQITGNLATNAVFKFLQCTSISREHERKRPFGRPTCTGKDIEKDNH